MGLRATLSCLAAAVCVVGAADAQSLFDRGPVGFTEQQARRGQTVYAESCASCHGPHLNDGQFGPPVKGAAFKAHWHDQSPEALWTQSSSACRLRVRAVSTAAPMQMSRPTCCGKTARKRGTAQLVLSPQVAARGARAQFGAAPCRKLAPGQRGRRLSRRHGGEKSPARQAHAGFRCNAASACGRRLAHVARRLCHARLQHARSDQ